jgi:hypothetical protein
LRWAPAAVPVIDIALQNAARALLLPDRDRVARFVDGECSSPAFRLPGKSKPPIIRITVGYPWSKNNDNQVVAAIADERWKSIRDCVTPVGDWVKTYVSKRLP